MAWASYFGQASSSGNYLESRNGIETARKKPKPKIEHLNGLADASRTLDDVILA
ncbi:MAG: hypothetical protein L7S56_02170 [Candidatus Poseidonia sp.]|nr:hypothetical protein [Poseidonia sp.]